MDREYILRIEKIEALLEEKLPRRAGAAWIAETFPGFGIKAEMTEALLVPGRDLFERGGKRWRPLFSLLVCQALGGGDAALPLLPLVEFAHTGSLIHDDLEDNSDERRGKPAVHLIYGRDTAINSGSFLYFLPLASLENWEAGIEAKAQVWQLWGEHMRLLHLGQSMDIAWHRDSAFIPSINEYMLMCGLKTGCLARMAALLGACAAGIYRDGLAAKLGNAAEKLGVGFQILDDVKNLGTGIPGKRPGDDVTEGKKSLPVILFLRDNPADRAAFTRRCFDAARQKGVDAPEVKEFTAALAASGALEEAETQGRALIAEAGSALGALPEAVLNPKKPCPAQAEACRLLAGFTELLK